MLHGSETTDSTGDDWNCGPILFPFPNCNDSENSYHDQSLSVPPPPPYVPERPYSDGDVEEQRKFIRDDTIVLGGGSVVQPRGPDGEYYYKYKDFAMEALKWYNNKEGRKFELVKLVEVILRPFRGVVCDLTMEAMDADAPTDPPLTFEAVYNWATVGEKEGDDTIVLVGGGVVQPRGPDGEHYYKYKNFATEALKWYNNKEGRKFELVKLVEVALRPTCGVVCDLTMEAMDADAPRDPPLTFEAVYNWARVGEKEGVYSCHPI